MDRYPAKKGERKNKGIGSASVAHKRRGEKDGHTLLGGKGRFLFEQNIGKGSVLNSWEPQKGSQIKRIRRKGDATLAHPVPCVSGCMVFRVSWKKSL